MCLPILSEVKGSALWNIVLVQGEFNEGANKAGNEVVLIKSKTLFPTWPSVDQL
jgi:hypothetical protein